MPYCPECGHEVSPAARRCPSCGAAREASPTTRRGKRGLPWPVLLLGCGGAVLLFGGVVAAIFIPNFTDSLQKARQKRTMADMQEVAAALEAYRAEHAGRVPDVASLDELAPVLAPAYMAEVWRTDAWKNPLLYACWSEELPADPGNGGCDTYRLVSPGRDGVFEEAEPADYDVAPFPRSEYDRDLVVGDGYVYRYPSGDGTATAR